MKTLLIASALALASVSLSGCVTASLAKMTPEQQTATIKALGDAGCAGSLHVKGSAATASGVSAGSASGEIEFNGGCDPSKRVVQTAPPVAQ